MGHMKELKRNSSALLPYEHLITQILSNAANNMEGET